MVRKLLNRENKTKADLIDAVYQRHGGLTRDEAAEIVDAIFMTVKSSLSDGRSVRIRNLGVFKVTPRSDRAGVDPVSGRKMLIPAHTGLTFRPSRHLTRTLKPGESEGD